MKNEIVQALTDTFEGHTRKAKTAFELSDHRGADHFGDVNKMVALTRSLQAEATP